MSAKSKTKTVRFTRRGTGKSFQCRRWCVAAGVIIAARTGLAQQALHNAWSGQSAADARHRLLESENYTFKEGDLRLLVTPSMSFQYNDNINLAQTNIQQDFIISPTINFDLTYPITDFNILDVSLGAMYNEYVEHGYLSNFGLNSTSTSGISFGMVLKSFSLEVHDRAGYFESSQEAAVAGSAEYRDLNNSAGFRLTENLNDVTLGLNYDHQNTISLSGQFQSQDSAAELVVGSVGFRLDPRLLVGLDASGTFTTYDQAVLDNNDNYSAGVHADWRPGNYFHITPRIGYTVTQFSQSGTNQTPSLSSYYFDVSATHDITKFISYTFSVGRETRGGVQADAIQDYYFRPSIRWKVIRKLSITTTGDYEHGTQGGGNGPGIIDETYDYYGGTVSLAYQWSKRITSSLNNQLTVRHSTVAGRAYTQDVVLLNVAYHF
jgi:hypothetical protein